MTKTIGVGAEYLGKDAKAHVVIHEHEFGDGRIRNQKRTVIPATVVLASPALLDAAAFAAATGSEAPDGLVTISKQTFDELKAAVAAAGLTLDQATALRRTATTEVR